jgi:hypothetical protein
MLYISFDRTECRLIAELWMRKFVKNYTYLTDLLARLADLNTVLDRSKFHPQKSYIVIIEYWQ